MKSVAYRRSILEIIVRAGAGHTGSDLSCIDILNVLYDRILRVTPERPDDPDRDRYIQSKGHAAEALYVVLADRGFFPAAELGTLYQEGTRLLGHPTRQVPGVEHNTGALGHGLSVAVGLALAAKLSGRPYRVFALLGDGELAEGSIWEASLAAAHHRLDNLVAIVDRNTLQISGCTEVVCALEPLEAKFAAFGYAVRSVNGHDLAALEGALSAVPFASGRPSLLLARTTKGRGVSFMEGAPSWHHHVPSAAELALALAELDDAATQLCTEAP